MEEEEEEEGHSHGRAGWKGTEEKHEGGRELLLLRGDYFPLFAFLLHSAIPWRLFSRLGEESVCRSARGGSIGGAV